MTKCKPRAQCPWALYVAGLLSLSNKAQLGVFNNGAAGCVGDSSGWSNLAQVVHQELLAAQNKFKMTTKTSHVAQSQSPQAETTEPSTMATLVQSYGGGLTEKGGTCLDTSVGRPGGPGRRGLQLVDRSGKDFDVLPTQCLLHHCAC